MIPLPPFRQAFDATQELVRVCIAIAAGDYSVIYVATPPEITSSFAELLASLRAGCRVVLEKPWAPDLTSLLKLGPIIQRSPSIFQFQDHYLHKPVVQWLLCESIPWLLGSPITRINGHLFEKGTAASPAQLVGVSKDLLTHLLSAVQRLCPLQPMMVREIQVERHPQWPAPTESFVRIKGEITTPETVIPFDLAAAKDFPYDEKRLILEGKSSSLIIDFNASTADLLHADNEISRVFPTAQTPVSNKPYEAILEGLAKGDQPIGLNFGEAVHVMKVLDQIARMMPDELPSYQRGTDPRK